MAEIYEKMRNYLLPTYILGVDINKIQEPVSRPNGYPSYQISICTEGSGIYIDENDREHCIDPGDLFIFSPNTPHRYKAVTDIWRLPFIVFTGHSAPAIMDYLGFDKSLVLNNINSEDFRQISVLFNKIYNIYNSDEDLRSARTSSMVYSLLITISGICRSHSKMQNELSVQLAPALNYIKRNVHKDISVDTLAKIVGVSSGRLSVLFKHAFGTSPAQTIRLYKLEHSKHLMDSRPDIKIKELAERCGFTSPSYFVTAFKKEFGISPTDYKNNFKSNFMW